MHVVQDLGDVHAQAFELQLAGLDLGEVQHVVDDAQQVLAGPLDLVQVVALGVVVRDVERQVGEPDDGVHRRADLMAHVGQKGRFETGGGFGRLLGFAQGLDRGPLDADVLHDAQHPLGGILRVDQAGGDARPEQAAILTDQLLLAPVQLAALENLVDLAPTGFVSGIVGIPDPGGAADHAPRREAEHLVAPLVAVGDVTVLEQADAHRHGVDNGFLFGVGAAQGLGQIRQLAGAFVHQFGEVTAQTLEFLRRLLALGDVAGDAQDTDDLAMAVQHGTLDRLDQAGLGAAGKGDPLLVHVRLARAHRQEVVLAEQRGLLG